MRALVKPGTANLGELSRVLRVDVAELVSRHHREWHRRRLNYFRKVITRELRDLELRRAALLVYLGRVIEAIEPKDDKR